MSGKIDWKTDANNILMGVATHDATLFDASYKVAKLFEITFINSNNEKVRFRLTGVKKIRVEDFLDGMVILNIFVWPVATLDFNLASGYGWKKLFGFLRTEDDIRRSAERIVKSFPNANLVQFSGSDGGEISVICDQMDVEVL